MFNEVKIQQQWVTLLYSVNEKCGYSLYNFYHALSNKHNGTSNKIWGKIKEIKPI